MGITSGTTINAAGNYCIEQSMTGNIVINANDVSLNLNNRTVTGTITVNENLSGISICNGTVNADSAATGILVNSGASGITIYNVMVKNAITGIDFVSASNATVEQCTLTPIRLAYNSIVHIILMFLIRLLHQILMLGLISFHHSRIALSIVKRFQLGKVIQ